MVAATAAAASAATSNRTTTTAASNTIAHSDTAGASSRPTVCPVLARVDAPAIVRGDGQRLTVVMLVLYLPRVSRWLWLLLFLALLRTTFVQLSQASVRFHEPPLPLLLVHASATTATTASTASTSNLSTNVVGITPLSTPQPRLNETTSSNVPIPLEPKRTEEQLQSVEDPVYEVHSWSGSTASMEHLVRNYFVNSPSQPYCEALASVKISPNATNGADNASSSISGIPIARSTVTQHQFDLSQGCQHLFDASGWGTGNIISFLYSMRLVTLAHNANVLKSYKGDNSGIKPPSNLVALNMTCPDAEQTKGSLILPWLMGHTAPQQPVAAVAAAAAANPSTVHDIPHDLSLSDACTPNYNSRIAYMVREMQYDFRRMAVGLVGIVGLSANASVQSEHPSVAFADTYLGLSSRRGQQKYKQNQTSVPFHAPPKHLATTAPMAPQLQQTVPPASSLVPQIADIRSPVYASFERDDVVIHFRCGDLINTDEKYYSFLKFKSYTQLISPEARSIGIITQYIPPAATTTHNDTLTTSSTGNAHKEGQMRLNDRSTVVHDRCRAVVQAFYDTIRQRHPHSRVTIHNGPYETIALAYARMVMANQTIASSTSTFGVFPLIATFGTGYFLYPPRGSPIRWIFKPKIDTLISNVRLIREPTYMLTGDMKKLWETKGADAALAWFKS